MFRNYGSASQKIHFLSWQDDRPVLFREIFAVFSSESSETHVVKTKILFLIFNQVDTYRNCSMKDYAGPPFFAS